MNISKGIKQPCRDEQKKLAIKVVVEHGITLHAVSQKFHIPYITIFNNYNEKFIKKLSIS